MTTQLSLRRAMAEDVHQMFHQYWQVFTALATYTAILERSPLIIGEERQVVEELKAMVQKLQDQTEAIRVRVLAIIG